MIKISIEKVENLVNQLPVSDKVRLLRRLQQQTWAKRLDEVVGRIRSQFKKNPISDQEITRLCQEARQQIYNEKAK